MYEIRSNSLKLWPCFSWPLLGFFSDGYRVHRHEQKLQGGNKENKAVECTGPTIPCPETEFRYWVTRGEMDGLRKDQEGI